MFSTIQNDPLTWCTEAVNQQFCSSNTGSRTVGARPPPFIGSKLFYIFFNQSTIMVCVSCSWRCPVTQRLAQHTWCPCISAVSEAKNWSRMRVPWRGPCQLKTPIKGLRIKVYFSTVTKSVISRDTVISNDKITLKWQCHVKWHSSWQLKNRP